MEENIEIDNMDKFKEDEEDAVTADETEETSFSFDPVKSWDAYRDNWRLDKNMAPPPLDVLKEIDVKMEASKIVDFETALGNKRFLRYIMEESKQINSFSDFKEKDYGKKFTEFVIKRIVEDGKYILSGLMEGNRDGYSFGYRLKNQRNVKVISIDNDGKINFYKKDVDKKYGQQIYAKSATDLAKAFGYEGNLKSEFDNELVAKPATDIAESGEDVSSEEINRLPASDDPNSTSYRMKSTLSQINYLTELTKQAERITGGDKPEENLPNRPKTENILADNLRRVLERKSYQLDEITREKHAALEELARLREALDELVQERNEKLPLKTRIKELLAKGLTITTIISIIGALIDYIRRIMKALGTGSNPREKDAQDSAIAALAKNAGQAAVFILKHIAEAIEFVAKNSYLFLLAVITACIYAVTNYRKNK